MLIWTHIAAGLSIGLILDFIIDRKLELFRSREKVLLTAFIGSIIPDIDSIFTLLRGMEHLHRGPFHSYFISFFFIGLGTVMMWFRLKKFIFNGTEFIALGFGHLSHYILDFFVWELIQSNEDLIVIEQICSVPSILIFMFLMFLAYRWFRIPQQSRPSIARRIAQRVETPHKSEKEVLQEYILSISLLFFIIGALFEGILIVIGGVLALANYFGLRVPALSREETGDSWPQSFRSLLSDYKFLLVFAITIIWVIIYSFNLLTFPPNGPLYYLREAELMKDYPDVPIEDLPSKSTFSIFGLLMDSGILLMLLYILYLYLRPGKQPFEDVVNSALSRNFFMFFLILASLYHIIGHLPLELYGKGQWGTGYGTIAEWIAFDKFAHMFASILITMLLAGLLIEYLTRVGARHERAPLFSLLVAIAFMMLIGVLWEFGEWIINLILDPVHFIDEILDAPKDLVYDFIGALLGAIFSIFDLRNDLGNLLIEEPIID